VGSDKLQSCMVQGIKHWKYDDRLEAK